MLKDEKKILNPSTLISGGGFKGVSVFLSHVAALGVHCRDLIVSTNPRPRPRHALRGTAPPGARAGQKQRCQSPLSPGPRLRAGVRLRFTAARVLRALLVHGLRVPSLPKTGCRGRSSSLESDLPIRKNPGTPSNALRKIQNGLFFQEFWTSPVQEIAKIEAALRWRWFCVEKSEFISKAL